MNLLLDECVPKPLKPPLAAGGHTCLTAAEAGLKGKTNGELLRAAEKRFDVLITLDKGLPYQQNLSNLKIGVLIVRAKSNRAMDLLPHIPECLAILESMKPGEVRYAGK